MKFLQKKQSRSTGQSTVEFALALPILCALLYWVIAGFKANCDKSERSVKTHAEELEKFAHGHGLVKVDGLDVSLNMFLTLPSPYIFDPSKLPDLIKDAAQRMAGQWGLNKLMSHLPFKDGNTYLSGAARGGVQSAGNSFIQSGYRKVDWEKTAWGAATGALSSEQATRDFQGDNFKKGSFREMIGSGAQSGLVNYTRSEGNTKMILPGSVGGMLHSDTSREYFASGNEILKGAAKGAIESSVAGLYGEKVTFKRIATAAGLGAFNTNTVARAIPLTSWSGDPIQSASFRATNSALSVIINGGKSKDALYAAVSGAFYSKQSMSTIAGDSKYKAGMAGAAFGATMGWIQGLDSRSVGLSALQSMAGAVVAQKQQKLIQEGQDELQKHFNEITNASSNAQLQNMLSNPDIKNQTAINLAIYLNSLLDIVKPSYVSSILSYMGNK